MPAQYVKPYVKRGKHDAAYVEGICEAVTHPTMRFVAIKSTGQKSTLMQHRVRELLVRQRTMLANALRGHMAEFGIHPESEKTIPVHPGMLILAPMGPSPLAASSWAAAVPEFAALLYQSYFAAPSRWISSLSRDSKRAGTAIQYFLITILIAAAGWPLRRWLLTRYGRRPDIREPSYAQRLVAALVEAVGHGLIPLLFVMSIRVLFVNDTMLNYELRVIVDTLTRHLAIFFVGYGLIKAVFTPDSSVWRLTPLHTGASRRVVQRLQAVLMIYVIAGALGESLTWSTPSNVLNGVYTLVFAMLLYPALWALLRHRVWLQGGAAAAKSVSQDVPYHDVDFGRSSRFWIRMRTGCTIALFSIPAAAVAGYPKLSMFLIDATMLTGLVTAGFLALRWLVHSALAEVLARRLDDGEKGLGLVPSIMAPIDGGPARLSFWAYLLIDVCLLIAAASVLVPLWGLDAPSILAGVSRLFRGIQIGTYTFSLLDFVFAAGFFAAIMVATRLVQRGLERHFLPKVIRDVGVRDALRTAVGYVGVVVASLIAISTLGLDLSNLALIAGALSVGLGFGLQNVVSNFVSGLILLAERPIKPGDWIVVNAHEGTVKKVNVRSTEIETFQRASVIIPNADLIANPVTNWTHKNVLGRLEVRIGVAYGSDVELVRDTLLEIAEAHSMVIADPAPSVIFRDFGASSLDFELRCFLHDVGWVVVVGSELRFTINAEFNRLGIDVPFPQQVVHFADSMPEAPKQQSKPKLKPKQRKTPSDIGPESDGDGI